MLTTTARILRNTIQHLIRNPYHTLAAILTMSLTSFAVAVFVLILAGSGQVLNYLETRPQVIAFFKLDTSEEHILQLKSQLEKSGQTTKVDYVNKQQALDIYKEQNINDPELLEFVTADILPASLEVSPMNIGALASLAQILSQDSQVERVIFQKDVVESLQAFLAKARMIGYGLVTILGVVSLLTVLIVISSNISSFGKEIEIMKLVGASSWYVRWPFLLDGALFGVLASSLAVGILYLFLPQIRFWSSNLIPGVQILPVADQLLLNLWLGLTLGGVTLGILGSFAAMWKHLRV